MKSAAQYHFPQVIFDDGRKWLFNPVLKKRFKNRPEERVRLQWVEFLLHQTGWSKNRIGFETPVQLRREDRALRADLLLYSDEVAPQVLIECKSDDIRLTDAAAVQAARYNSLLHAPYIILTNGIEDLVYKVEDGIAVSSDYPMSVRKEHEYRRVEYWQKRGCCSGIIRPELRDRMESLQVEFWKKNDEAVLQYLSFEETFLPIPMDHFYQIFSVRKKSKLALTLAGLGPSPNYLVAVLNQKGTNRGVCAVNLDEIAGGEKASIQLFMQNKEVLTGSDSLRELIMEPADAEFQKTLVNMILSFFD